MKRLVTALLLILFTCPGALAAERMALVIGNGAYSSAPLRNPVNDATDMAAALQKLGFRVTLLTNADQRTMEDAVHAFGKSLRNADIRLFYYAGHGMQIQGVNYLVPVRSGIRSEADVKYNALPAGKILDNMDSGSGTNIVILDACRNNPLARSFRSATRGLARMDAPKGTIIAYATAPGEEAADGNGRNGVFTRYILENIRSSGLTVEQIFKRAGRAVLQETKSRQTPWMSSSLYDDVYLAGNRGGATVSPPATSASSPNPNPTHVASATPPKAPPAGRTWNEPTTGMEFVWVPGGSFMMGSDTGNAEEKPVHPVSLPGFWIGKYEVTQDEWKRVMGSTPSHYKGGRNPVEQVSWDDAQQFIAKLNAMGSARFALPSEAQWEYAARSGGRDEKYSGGDNVDRVAWYASNSLDKTRPVGTRDANGLGLHDMSGNVWEWCADRWHNNYSGAPSDGSAWVSGNYQYRVIRGCGWSNKPWGLRTTYRGYSEPDTRNRDCGFRLVRLK